jgi:Transglycosylase SLT domain
MRDRRPARSFGWLIAAGVVAQAALPHDAKAAATPPSPFLCTRALEAADTSASTMPPGLLKAIAQVESGRPTGTGQVVPWPWTINFNGVGYFYPTKAEAIKAVQSLQAGGGESIDVGCMQVNLKFHPQAFASLDDAFDPTRNVGYASRFLRSLYAASSSWPKAAADYHSQTVDIGAAYERRVAAAWRDMHGAGVVRMDGNRTAEFNRLLREQDTARAARYSLVRWGTLSPPANANRMAGQPARPRDATGGNRAMAQGTNTGLVDFVR